MTDGKNVVMSPSSDAPPSPATMTCVSSLLNQKAFIQFNGLLYYGDFVSLREPFTKVCVNGSLPKYIIRKVAREAPEKVVSLLKWLVLSCRDSGGRLLVSGRQRSC